MSSDDEISFVSDSAQHEDDEEYSGPVSSSGDQWDKDQQLWYAIEHRDVEKVQLALQNGANVNCIVHEFDEYIEACTPLYEACEHGLDNIVRILLDAGANAWVRDTTYSDGFGWSALHAACREGHLSTVEMLINHDNGLLEITDNAGRTPLIYAITRQHLEMIHFLLDRGANVFATNRGKLTTLMHACTYPGLIEIVRLLIAAGVDVNARDQGQLTALHHTSHGEIEAARELILHHNADMLALDDKGLTTFDWSWRSERTVVADLLLEMYGDKLTQCDGRLALHVLFKVAEYFFAELEYVFPPFYPLRINLPLGKLRLQHFRTLLQYFAPKICNRDDAGKLPIHVACQTNAPVEVLSMLVELDSATLKIADHTGNLPLHECCSGVVDYSSVRHLVEKGGVGTLAARNNKGLLPLHKLCGSKCASLRTVQYLMQSFPGSIMAQTNTGQYQFMVAASTPLALSVLYELVRANPGLLLPRG